jgi:hypothetical protein
MVDDCSPEELAYLASSFAVALTKGMDAESVRVMCNFFVNVVGTLNLILAQKELLKKRCHPPKPPHKPRDSKDSSHESRREQKW